MLSLCLDTETTGMWDKYLPPNSPKQPVAIQLAYILFEDDHRWESHSWVLQPLRPIGEGAAKVHGISNAAAEAHGHRPGRALGALVAAMEMLAEGDIILGHNIEFDLNVLRATAHAMDRADVAEFIDRKVAECKVFCTMHATTPICKIPSPHPGFGDKYKWPKLTEAHRHFFNCDFEGAHDALADVEATIKVYQALQDLETEAA